MGILVLWSSYPDRIDERGSLLKHGEFEKLALANPRLAPYGAAAVEVLDNLGLAEQTRDRWVQGENIAQTYQFVHSGNAEIGFVSLSQIMAGGSLTGGSAWIVPDALYSPIRQDGVLLKRAAGNAAARAFMTFLASHRAREMIKSFGYNVKK
jgi:molybdate transport system substrate-binding protein